MNTVAFPKPPPQVNSALNLLTILRVGSEKERRENNVHGGLPRPWDPVHCDEELATNVWRWCDDVAAWLNATYAWRPAQMIPACWPEHADLVTELPVLAVQAWMAYLSTDVTDLGLWQLELLPRFQQRVAERLGDSSCRTGAHQDWPAAARFDAFETERHRAHHQRLLAP